MRVPPISNAVIASTAILMLSDRCLWDIALVTLINLSIYYNIFPPYKIGFNTVKWLYERRIRSFYQITGLV